MTKYNANSAASRQLLATALINRLKAAGFEVVTPERRTTEICLGYRASATIGIKVMTSAVNVDGHPEMRGEGADAIRVTAVNLATGRGYIGGLSRVNRTGEIDAIVERTMKRARLCWAEAKARHEREAGRVAA